MKRFFTLSAILLIFIAFISFAEEEGEKEKDLMNSATFSGLKIRGIGPGVASGRIIDFAVNPCNSNEFYVAVASGGVWKTTNDGTTFTPIFDSQGSYSIGCVELDPNNHNVVWVGTGENNSQRSVSWGDGIYKSTDGGKSWENMGLEDSEHIGKIWIDPRNSDVVFVAAQGPLWNAGGDRGLYKTTDGGKTWEKSLFISDDTGISDLIVDPRDPDVMYCSSYQRRRHVWTLINGGPEAAMYKSVDGGKNWDKLTSGLPGGYVGRIGMAISPVNPDYIFALIEATGDKGGLFRSTDRGASWEKRSNYKSVSAQYYQELFCDPVNVDKIFSVDTYTKYSEDGGKTWQRLSLSERHVDDHALWINPKNTDNLLIGGDGGIYETFDHGKTWKFFSNLPVTQFYRVSVDYEEPFYYVYAGTQDNNTLGGPSRTVNAYGIMNQDWFFVVGGDGFKAVVDPKNPDIIYAQPQYGFLVRYDKKSGQMTGIQPQPEPGEEHRWNWDSPVIISPHDNKTLYFAANRVYKTTNRGDSWTAVSPDLTQQIDRNQLEIMGRIWEPETPAKNASTSLYGNIVSLEESPVKQGLLYAGTDDGLIQVSENDGESWTKIDQFPDVPKNTYVSDIICSQFDENVVFACFDNHKRGDFKPYVLKSTDKGKTWSSIAGNLEEPHVAWSIAQDHENKDLLFLGTEYGFFFSLNGGEKWIQAKNGLPTIAIRDIDVQRRENDVALASFGRGIYLFENYAPLREVTPELFEKDAHIFDIKNALLYMENRSHGRRSLGAEFYRADNAPFGATFTYYLKESVETKKQKRIKKSKKIRKGGENPPYPSFEEMRKEDIEESPYLIFTIKNSKGEIIRRLTESMSKGINRITWDLRYPDTAPISSKTNINENSGFLVYPGQYTVTMSKSVDGKVTDIAGPEEFTVEYLDNATLDAEDKLALDEFRDKVMSLRNAYEGTNKYLHNAKERIDVIRKSLLATREAPIELVEKARDIELQLLDIEVIMTGDKSKSSRNANQTPSINDRLGNMLYSMFFTSSAPTETNKEAYRICGRQLENVITQLDKIVRTDLAEIEQEMNKLESPWTPGRLPDWKMK